jgi:hypothetical protein
VFACYTLLVLRLRLHLLVLVLVPSAAEPNCITPLAAAHLV